MLKSLYNKLVCMHVKYTHTLMHQFWIKILEKFWGFLYALRIDAVKILIFCFHNCFDQKL